jgi:hypothetical protein
MSSKPRLDRALALRRSRPIQQFGQGDDYYTFNGATGCTHTVLQTLALLWRGKFYSHDEISRLAGYPPPGSNRGRRGLSPSEVMRFCNAARLPYKLAWGLSSSQVLQRSNYAPVMFGHAYSWTPEWKGYRYGGLTADGRPNGFASPSGRAGKTQLSGFTGAHASLLLGYLPDPYRAYVHEPNHGSPTRSEKPPYDIYAFRNFRPMYDSYRTVLRRTAYALIPTKGL